MVATGKRIKELREKRGLSQATLARAVGIKSPSLSDIETGKTKRASGEVLVAIANQLRCDPEYLLNGRMVNEILANRFKVFEKETSPYNVVTGPAVKGTVPLISWVKAGEWSSVADAFSPGDAEAWMPCPTKFGQHTFALRVRGVSMEPKFQDGDIIFVDPDASADHGKNVVVRLQDEDEATFKQLVVEGSKMFLKPLNPDWPGQKLIPINGNATICGVVIGKWVTE